MYNFDPYSVLLVISTNITAAYDCVCAPGSHMCNQIKIIKYLLLDFITFFKYMITYNSLNCNKL